MDDSGFALRDLPQREVLEQYAGRFPDLDITAVETCLAILGTANDLLAAFNGVFSRFNLSQGRFIVLMLLYRQPDHQLTPSSLSEKMGVARATVTGLLDTLEKNGQVERSANPEDRRQIKVRLTQKGLRLLNEILPEHYRTTTEFMKGWDHGQQEGVLELLVSLRRHLRSLQNG